MELPHELQSHIIEFADNGPATLRADWREGSSIIGIFKKDLWWDDYMRCQLQRDEHQLDKDSWVDWCKYKMIIGPPRHRSYREEAELDEDYLSTEDIIRHCRPWSRTWPSPDDRSWCTGPHRTTLPDWVIAEFTA